MVVEIAMVHKQGLAGQKPGWRIAEGMVKTLNNFRTYGVEMAFDYNLHSVDQGQRRWKLQQRLCYHRSDTAREHHSCM